MLPNAYQQYRATKVETAGSVDLVVMLYQGAVRFVRQGIQSLDQDDAPLLIQTLFVLRTSSSNCSARSIARLAATSPSSSPASTTTAIAV